MSKKSKTKRLVDKRQLSGNRYSIPVIDLFAGPGGLGEGFSAYTDKYEQRVFDIFLSVEKQIDAFKTLELRSFFRKFPKGKAPEEYYDYLKGKLSREELFEKFPKEAGLAKREAIHGELGDNKELNRTIDLRIKEVIRSSDCGCWGLIGGPPCQAYSIVGRSRNSGNKNYTLESDHRSYLYREYLRIISHHKPAFFIMENVKGMLSSKLNGKFIFEKIIDDLRYPAKYRHHSKKNAEYEIYSLSSDSLVPARSSDYVVESEYYSIPQTRHRVILFGVRKDFTDKKPDILKRNEEFITVKDVLEDIPKLRSGLSRENKNDDTYKFWVKRIRKIFSRGFFRNGFAPDVKELIKKAVPSEHDTELLQGADFIPYKTKKIVNKKLAAWYQDDRLKGVCNHTSRSHMLSDLHRYLYAACFARQYRKSPLMKEFPEELLPRHKNARSGHFNDRFRVQIADKPSSTITSHLSKDGHYFIHYDPAQCRSLTVREAARLQTFPDNYFFEGSRTQQYIQVGNAVPPLLAMQIAEVVYKLIEKATE